MERQVSTTLHHIVRRSGWEKAVEASGEIRRQRGRIIFLFYASHGLSENKTKCVMHRL